MNKQFLSALTKFEEHEFMTLEYHIHTARWIRNTMVKYGINKEEMAKFLGAYPERMKEVLNGSYPYDIELIAKLQSKIEELEMDISLKKVEQEGIGFSTYKHQFPLYVDRIEKLISILEKQNTPA